MRQTSNKYIAIYRDRILCRLSRSQYLPLVLKIIIHNKSSKTLSKPKIKIFHIQLTTNHPSINQLENNLLMIHILMLTCQRKLLKRFKNHKNQIKSTKKKNPLLNKENKIIPNLMNQLKLRTPKHFISNHRLCTTNNQHQVRGQMAKICNSHFKQLMLLRLYLEPTILKILKYRDRFLHKM